MSFLIPVFLFDILEQLILADITYYLFPFKAMSLCKKNKLVRHRIPKLFKSKVGVISELGSELPINSLIKFGIYVCTP